jgi:hypothetical protein
MSAPQVVEYEGVPLLLFPPPAATTNEPNEVFPPLLALPELLEMFDVESPMAFV